MLAQEDTGCGEPLYTSCSSSMQPCLAPNSHMLQELSCGPGLSMAMLKQGSLSEGTTWWSQGWAAYLSFAASPR